jgi:hypothetical protein
MLNGKILLVFKVCFFPSFFANDTSAVALAMEIHYEQVDLSHTLTLNRPDLGNN